MCRDIDKVSVHSRWPLTTGVAQGRYYCTTQISDGPLVDNPLSGRSSTLYDSVPIFSMSTVQFLQCSSGSILWCCNSVFLGLPLVLGFSQFHTSPHDIVAQCSGYGVPFSHVFTELQISPIEGHISAIELEISQNRQYLEISPIQLNVSPIQLQISGIQWINVKTGRAVFTFIHWIDLEISAIHLEISAIQLEISPIRPILRYLQLNWRYVQFNWRYLQFSE